MFMHFAAFSDGNAIICTCGAHYINNHEGRPGYAAHLKTVFETQVTHKYEWNWD